MEDTPTPSKFDAVTRFWSDYLAELERKGVPESARPWYRKHVEQFIGAHPGVRLREVQAPQVQAYLRKAGRNTRLADWQMKQCADSLQVLFCNMLSLPWCRSMDWSLAVA